MINILDGTITYLCQVPHFFDEIVTTLELANPAPCDLLLDLDCDDNSSIVDFDCLDLSGVPISDDDIRIFADAFLEEMTITIAATIPDAPDEILLMTGSIPNIDETGSGTSAITLTNAGGATIQDLRMPYNSSSTITYPQCLREVYVRLRSSLLLHLGR